MYQCNGWPLYVHHLWFEVYVQVDSRMQSCIITLYLLFSYMVVVQHPVKMYGVSELISSSQLLLNQHIAYYRTGTWSECYESVNLCTEILVHKKLLM